MTTANKGMDRRQFMRISGLGLATAAATPAMAACATSGTDKAGSGKKTLKIGAFFPVSGSLALLGEESWRGIQIATDLRNKAGGVAGKKVEMVFADVPDVNAATSEARRLASDPNVKMAIGTYSSALCLAATEVFSRGGRTYVEVGAISEAITDRAYKNVYRFCPSAGKFTKMQMRFISEYLSKKLSKPVSELRVILAHEDSAYGQSVAKNAKKDAAAAGLTSFSVEPYNAKSTDLSSTVLRMKSKSPDIVMAVSYAADAVLLGRQIRDNGLKLGAFIGTGGGHGLISFRDALGSAADGVFNVDFSSIYANEKFTPGLAAFVVEYQKRYKALPASGHSLANFSGAGLLFDLLEKTGGSDDPAALRKVAMSYRLDPGTTAAGWGFELNEHNQNIRADVCVAQWKGKKLETVWPPEAAIREPEIVTPFGV